MPSERVGEVRLPVRGDVIGNRTRMSRLRNWRTGPCPMTPNSKLAPGAGIEPAPPRLTTERATITPPWKVRPLKPSCSGTWSRTRTTTIRAWQAFRYLIPESATGTGGGTRTRTASLEDSHASHYITPAKSAADRTRTCFKRIKNPLLILLSFSGGLKSRASHARWGESLLGSAQQNRGGTGTSPYNECMPWESNPPQTD